jgi:hypothetical protein
LVIPRISSSAFHGNGSQQLGKDIRRTFANIVSTPISRVYVNTTRNLDTGIREYFLPADPLNTGVDAPSPDPWDAIAGMRLRRLITGGVDASMVKAGVVSSLPRGPSAADWLPRAVVGQRQLQVPVAAPSNGSTVVIAIFIPPSNVAGSGDGAAEIAAERAAAASMIAAITAAAADTSAGSVFALLASSIAMSTGLNASDVMPSVNVSEIELALPSVRYIPPQVRVTPAFDPAVVGGVAAGGLAVVAILAAVITTTISRRVRRAKAEESKALLLTLKSLKPNSASSGDMSAEVVTSPSMAVAVEESEITTVGWQLAASRMGPAVRAYRRACMRMGLRNARTDKKRGGRAVQGLLVRRKLRSMLDRQVHVSQFTWVEATAELRLRNQGAIVRQEAARRAITEAARPMFEHVAHAHRRANSSYQSAYVVDEADIETALATVGGSGTAADGSHISRPFSMSSFRTAFDFGSVLGSSYRIAPEPLSPTGATLIAFAVGSSFGGGRALNREKSLAPALAAMRIVHASSRDRRALHRAVALLLAIADLRMRELQFLCNQAWVQRTTGASRIIVSASLSRRPSDLQAKARQASMHTAPRRNRECEERLDSDRSDRTSIDAQGVADRPEGQPALAEQADGGTPPSLPSPAAVDAVSASSEEAVTGEWMRPSLPPLTFVNSPTEEGLNSAGSRTALQFGDMSPAKTDLRTTRRTHSLRNIIISPRSPGDLSILPLDQAVEVANVGAHEGFDHIVTTEFVSEGELAEGSLRGLTEQRPTAAPPAAEAAEPRGAWALPRLAKDASSPPPGGVCSESEAGQSTPIAPPQPSALPSEPAAGMWGSWVIPAPPRGRPRSSIAAARGVTQLHVPVQVLALAQQLHAETVPSTSQEDVTSMHALPGDVPGARSPGLGSPDRRPSPPRRRGMRLSPGRAPQPYNPLPHRLLAPEGAAVAAAPRSPTTVEQLLERTQLLLGRTPKAVVSPLLAGLVDSPYRQIHPNARRRSPSRGSAPSAGRRGSRGSSNGFGGGSPPAKR